MGSFNRRHLYLQRADGTILQGTGADRVDCQFASRDDPAGELPGRDRISLHGIRYCAEGHLSVFPGQTVIGILRHPHGYPDPDPRCDHPDSITEEDVLQETVFRIFFRFGAVDETDVQRDSRNITPGIELGLCRITHKGIALRFGFCVIAVSIFLGFGNREMNPFRMGVGIDQRTVDIQFRQIQHVPVSVFTGRHDPGNYVGQVDIIGDAQQVLRLPDLYVAVLSNPFHDENIPPIPGELSGIFLHDTAFTEDGVHGVHILKLHILRCAVQVRIEGKVMLGQAGRRYGLYNGSPHRRG